MTRPLEQHYTVPEVAAAFSVDERTVRSWIESKNLPAIRVGRHYRIPASAIQSLKNDMNETDGER